VEKNYQIVNIGHFVSRTGTVFLHSLLDSHPQILTMPAVINFRNLLNKRNFYTAEEAFEIFDKENPKFYDTSLQKPSDVPDNGLYKLGDNKDDKILTNKKAFKAFFLENLKSSNSITFKNVLVSLNIAYGKTHNKDINKCKVILLHPHEKKDCITFNKLFENSKFLIPVRNPLNVYNSIIKMIKFRKKIRSQLYYPSGQLIQFAKGLDDFRYDKMNMHILKLENLEQNFEVEMKKICNYMEIDFDSCVLKSTFGGKKFWGNTYKNPREKYVPNKINIEKTLSKKDLIILSKINEKIMEEFGYNNKSYTNKSEIFSTLNFFFPLDDEIEFLKNFKFKNLNSYLKFLCYFLPKRIYLAYICLKR
tara:strand:+ start:79 stop:1164 length:1086 start_codon:yes stop_codon:yes gene_type:complete